MSRVAFSLAAVVAVGVVVVPVGKVAGQECQQRLEDGQVARTLRAVVLESSVAPWVLFRQQQQQQPMAARRIWLPTRAAGRIGARAAVSGIGRFVGPSAVATIVMVLGTLWYGLHRSLGANWRVGLGLRCAAAAVVAAGRRYLSFVAAAAGAGTVAGTATAAAAAAAAVAGAVAVAGVAAAGVVAGGSSAGRCFQR